MYNIQYRVFGFLDSKVVLLLLFLSVGDDVEGGEDDDDDQEDCDAADDQDRPPTNCSERESQTYLEFVSPKLH